MASLFNNVIRVTDASGVPVSGGKVRVYNANTTTLSSLYSDVGLTTPLTNPVVADSAGYAPQIFLASANYDVATLTAADVVLKTQDDVPSLGSDSSTLVKDFTNSRFQARGSGGTVFVEAGDASPDDAGGTMRVGGWNGTQADLITVDSASLNTTGILTEAGKKLPSIVTTPAVTFTAAATVDIPLTAFPTGVLAWDIDVWDYTMSSSSNTFARLSYDGGATYKAGATDYFGHFITIISSGLSVTADITTTRMELCSNMPAAGVFKIRVITPPSGSADTRLTANIMGLGNSSNPMTVFANWLGKGSYGKADHLRLLGATGTISGKYRVTALRGFGEP